MGRTLLRTRRVYRLDRPQRRRHPFQRLQFFWRRRRAQRHQGA